ncbi:MAG: ATP-binding protein, partial [Acidobacteriota bacterium]
TVQNRLIEVEKLSAIGMLVSGIAHELNNPLTSIIGYTDLLYGKASDDRDRKKLEKIASEAQRAVRIVKNLSTFARESKADKSLIDINDLLRQVLKFKGRDFVLSNIRIVEKFSPGSMHAMANPAQMEQVFLNIINNAEHALKLIHGEKVITLETVSKDDWIEVRVKDNGPGISEEHLKKIFFPFFTTKDVGRGTGLGLSICYGIVDEHRGKIYAESESGRGATFVVKLPARRESARDAKLEMGSERIESGVLSGKKILIVDDEQAVQELVSEFLSIHGIIVEEASNGVDALDKVKADDYDLIIADIKMPVLSGISLYNIVREQYPALMSRFIFITGDSVNEETNQFIHQSGRPFLLKPFSSDDLYRVVYSFFFRTQP